MIYLVVGHPRSFTSMMMMALEAGGMRVARTETRERFNVTGEPYKPNAGGLYEVEPGETLEPGWPRQHEGKALKCLTSWVGRLSVAAYTVVFMRRDAEEIRQSYRAAFGISMTCKAIETQVDEALRTLHNRRDVVDIVSVQCRAVLEHPRQAMAVLSLAGFPIDARRAAEVIDPAQYRFRREKLVVGL